jgi:hypothetical protein
MTQPYAHCPFCLEAFDLVCDCQIISFGNMEMIQIDCPKHGTIVIISDNIHSKASPGSFLADCPECNKTVFLNSMTNLIGNG